MVLKICFEDFEEKDKWLNYSVSEWIPEVILEQPQLHQGC